MRVLHGLIAAGLCLLGTSCRLTPPAGGSPADSYVVRGVIRALPPGGRTALIQHEAIPGYMAAMTMPFPVRNPGELAGLTPGDQVTFRLQVTEDESWIDRVTRTGGTSVPAVAPPAAPASTEAAVPARVNLVDRLARLAFTNEFGQPLNFADYRGQALGLTFFFTRCPLPEYCPRLSKNFASATQKLQARPDAPTNWHFFSMTFDAEHDTPGVLRGYAKTYGYDSNRWTLVTSSQPVLDAVTQGLGFNFRRQGTTFDHQFVTLVIDAAGYRHTTWPVGGDTSDILVEAIIQAAATHPDPPTPTVPR